jgi:hypothetical protein
MSYDYFLFVKLLDVVFPTQLEYDLQFDIVTDLYDEFLEWDTMEGDLYEVIIQFLEENNVRIKHKLS